MTGGPILLFDPFAFSRFMRMGTIIQLLLAVGSRCTSWLYHFESSLVPFHAGGKEALACLGKDLIQESDICACDSGLLRRLRYTLPDQQIWITFLECEFETSSSDLHLISNCHGNVLFFPSKQASKLRCCQNYVLSLQRGRLSYIRAHNLRIQENFKQLQLACKSSHVVKTNLYACHNVLDLNDLIEFIVECLSLCVEMSEKGSSMSCLLPRQHRLSLR